MHNNNKPVAPDIAAALKSILDCGKKKQIFGILFFQEKCLV
jgi:hypothetical protein